MSKILSLVASAVIFCSATAIAQEFSIAEKPMELTTPGCTPDPTDYVLEFFTHVKNDLADPNAAITIEWTYLHNLTVQPAGWKLLGICDNDQCRAEDGPWFTGTPQFSFPFINDRDSSMLLELNVHAPTNLPDGVGTYYVEVKTPNQTDTAVFILTKTDGTSISTVSMKDQRISLYPNPSKDILNIYAAKSLNAKQISIYNLIGQEINTQELDKNNDVTRLNVQNLPSGIYMIRVANQNGEIVSTRKFLKD